MTDADIVPFLEVVKGLERVFPKKLEEHERSQRGRDYFKALRRFPLTLVSQGAENWLAHGKFFPKPAEWIESVPKRNEGTPLPELSDQELHNWQDAERRHWEGEPCKCGPCRQAGVDHRFIRFVPVEDSHGNVSKARIGDREITRGRWIHGDELQRWYAAREHYRGLFQQLMESR